MSERLGGTVTFLFTGIEGSTRLLEQLGRRPYGELLERHQALLRDAFARHGGEEIDTHGDAFFVAFRSAASAVAAAVSIQRALAKEQWADNVAVLVRIGIHTGEASASGERYIGFSVHRAARVGAVAHGGQVLLSSSTRELVGHDLPTGIDLQDLGLYRLKDVERPERIAQVIAEGLRSEFPPLRGAAIVKQPRLRRRRMLASAVVGAVAGPGSRRRRMLASALIAVVAAAVAVPLLALGSTSSQTSQPPATGPRTIVGTYVHVSHWTAGPNMGATVKATFRIMTFNRKTGAFTGTAVEATKPIQAVFALTGTVEGREIRMRTVDSAAGYKSHSRGRIRANGTIIGTETDNTGSRGWWTMTRR
ncbi:MAG TPA: adenylate/guanylate cyclase domain-containing protein [Gaiellaceae bacterium]|nr:adenylate/guanylate cyclase domain-containing protein [Gaiellaceae bacterium]